MLTDYHVHTQYSDDSDYPMDEVVQNALRLGLDALCFTDHVDYGVKRDWDDPRGVLYRPGGHLRSLRDARSRRCGTFRPGR